MYLATGVWEAQHAHLAKEAVRRQDDDIEDHWQVPQERCDGVRVRCLLLNRVYIGKQVRT